MPSETVVTAEDIEKFKRVAAALSPADRAAIMGAPPATKTPPHKMIPVLDTLSDAEVPRVVNACRAGLKLALEQGTTQADVAAVDEVAKVAPAVAVVIKANSEHRRKPYAHSLNVVCDYLQSEVFHAKRAAAARTVPARARASQGQVGAPVHPTEPHRPSQEDTATDA